MKFKDLVANSLPRVRGRKSKKSAPFHTSNHVPSKQEPEFSTHAPYFMQHSHPAFESRESSVERSSTVAVVDVPWREGAVKTSKAERPHPPCDTGLVSQTMTYYAPLTHQQHGMVMSHSADGISAQAMLLASPRDYVTGSRVTSLSDHYAATGNQHYPNMAATSETAVNYVGPNYVYHSQHQHQHHHHHHSHDYHYVYHHHHHDRQPYPPQNQPQVLNPDPLTERNYHQTHNTAHPRHSLGAEKPRKSESGGFLRKSFASFRAMRKAGSRSKEKDNRTNPQPDENDKCLVCPYPQPQAMDKNGSHKKTSKQSKKELKSLMKSKKNKHNSSAHDNQSDASWCSDNDAKMHQHSHHLHGFESVPYTAMNAFPVRECSMESSISRHTVAGSRERIDPQYFETASLSGYDSDATKNRTGRSRSRIKTNPWLPSPQPSLTMGRRFERQQPRDNNDDGMEDESIAGFPRSASFDYHSQLGISTFLSSNGQNEQRRNIQRHRSLTPVDLKLNLSLPRTKKLESPKPPEPKSHLNDLNTKSTKSRPNSIISPNSEFVALADNIEQLANNISFEYEDSFETSAENDATPGRGNASQTGQRRTTEEKNSKKRKSESSSPIPTDSVLDNAHSPDSGIGCLGSCDGDDSMTLSNAIVLEQSPTISIPSSQSTKSDSLNSTPKRKTTRNGGQVDGKSTKLPSSFLSSHSRDSEDGFGRKHNLSNPMSVSCHDGSRLLGSSSSESIASAVISESDIDNTSYKFVEGTQLSNNKSPRTMDPQKPQNVTPYLMVDERLDVNFRSLPRKLNGKQTKKRVENDGSLTISRSKNVIIENECTPSLVLSPNDRKSNSLSLTPVTKTSDGKSRRTKTGSRSSHDKENVGATELKCDRLDCKEEYEMAINFVDLRPDTYKPEVEIGGSVTMDTMDACVQTDFLSDFDTWERKQPLGLSPLDDSFDPVESTRRWLISGNMQGSADTGYSSQPRDSHVFMEEEAALLQFDALSDNGGQSPVQCKPKTSNTSLSCRAKLSPLDHDSSYDCSNYSNSFNQIPTLQPHKAESHGKPQSPTGREFEGNEPQFSECDLSKLLFGLTPPDEDDFHDVNKNDDANKAVSSVHKRRGDERKLSISDANKRHSSDSSTSTLTSDVVAVDKENDNNNCDNFGAPYFNSNTCRQKIISQTCSSNKETIDEDYHDYVNLPVRFFGAKNHLNGSLPHVNRMGLSHGEKMYGEQIRCQENRNNCVECNTVQQQNMSYTFDSRQIRAKSEESNKFSATHYENSHPFRCLEETPYFHGGDRPDYLEFLRDAPLQKAQPSASQIFIVPGFGPLEFPSRTVYPDFMGNFRCQKNLNSFNMDDVRSLSPQCANKNNNNNNMSSRSKNARVIKLNKEERPTNLTLLSYNCCPTDESGENQPSINSEQIKKDTKGQCIPQGHVKRKPHKDLTTKSNRCPTVRSYDVDDFAPINRVDLSSSSTSATSSRQERLSSTRNLAERVALLRREKEIIYRKIQEVQQQQELNRQREQFQQHRNLHSQRKEELLETLRILKEKLEEQSKKLQMKYREEM